MLHTIFTLALLLFLQPAFADTPPPAAPDDIHFTTVFYDDGGKVYVGLKRIKDGLSESQVITFPFPAGERTKLPLPEEIVRREVIGLVPDRQKLFVLTQGEGPKSGPMLHLYDQARNRWKKIGGIVCPSFTKVNLSATKMVFFCEGPLVKTRRGMKSTTVAKPLHFGGGERIYRGGTWRFPEFMLRYKSALLLLEGPAPVWEKLRIKSEQGERLITAEEMFELPIPPAPAPIAPTS